MKNDPILEFLRGHIELKRSALCTLYHPRMLNKSYIVQTSSVDEDGNILFNIIDSKIASISKNGEKFRLKLAYYKKGFGYYLTIDAAGTFDEPGGPSVPARIKARILSAEYSEGVQQNLHVAGKTPSLLRKMSEFAASFLL